MYIHRARRLAFVANPRTASHSVAEMLKRVGFEPCHNHHDGIYQEAYSVYPYDSPITPVNRLGWFVFAVVRNHWDAVCSMCFQVHGEPEAEGFTADQIEEALRAFGTFIGSDGVTLWGLHNDVDEVAYFERLRSELSIIVRQRCELPHLNASPRAGRHYSRFYSDEGRRHVGERFAREIERYGYAFEEKREAAVG